MEIIANTAGCYQVSCPEYIESSIAGQKKTAAWCFGYQQIKKEFIS
jgi:hypothetical protein